jgi:sterol desaturase/sphingolipid hydroxylase (fatty acid hydroxylase superfamily)
MASLAPTPARSRALTIVRAVAVMGIVVLMFEAALQLLGWINVRLRPSASGIGFLFDSGWIYLHVIFFAGVLIALERWMPGSDAPKNYASAALFWLFYVPVAVVAAKLAHMVGRAAGIQPLLDLRLAGFGLSGPPALLAHAGLIVAGAALFDFFYYWFHRLQHAVPLLWAFHSTHHSNRSLNAIGCYHHPLEDLWRIPLFLLPMAAVFQVVAPDLFLLTAFVKAWGLFNHADTSFNLGPLRRVLADNHYHRIHHSMAPEHYGSNFAGMFSLWDRLFGTQTMPQPGVEKLPVGLVDQPHPQRLRQYLLGPLAVLRGRRAAAAVAGPLHTD